MERKLRQSPLNQGDPQLIEMIRHSGLILPPMTGPYNIREPYKQQSQGQTQVVELLFKDEVEILMHKIM